MAVCVEVSGVPKVTSISLTSGELCLISIVIIRYVQSSMNR